MLNNTTQTQLYGNVTHYGHDLEGTTQLRLCMHENMCLLSVYMFVGVELCSSCETLWRYISASGIHESWIIYPTPMLRCFLYYSSLTSAYEVIQHVPLSFILPPLCFLCPCMHQCQSPSLPDSDL